MSLCHHRNKDEADLAEVLKEPVENDIFVLHKVPLSHLSVLLLYTSVIQSITVFIHVTDCVEGEDHHDGEDNQRDD